MEAMTTMTIGNLKITCRGITPAKLQELVTLLDSTDNREVGRKARKEEDKGNFGYGIIGAVKKAIQDRNRANQTTTNTKAAREDAMLRTRDSDGKATARK